MVGVAVVVVVLVVVIVTVIVGLRLVVEGGCKGECRDKSALRSCRAEGAGVFGVYAEGVLRLVRRRR